MNRTRCKRALVLGLLMTSIPLQGCQLQQIMPIIQMIIQMIGAAGGGQGGAGGGLGAIAAAGGGMGGNTARPFVAPAAGGRPPAAPTGGKGDDTVEVQVTSSTDPSGVKPTGGDITVDANGTVIISAGQTASGGAPSATRRMQDPAAGARRAQGAAPAPVDEAMPRGA